MISALDDMIHQFIEAETKWSPFRRRYFRIHFIVSKLYFDSNCTEICSPEFNQQKARTFSYNSLVPKKRQGIIWTNDGLVNWCTQDSLGLVELIKIQPGYIEGLTFIQESIAFNSFVRTTWPRFIVLFLFWFVVFVLWLSWFTWCTYLYFSGLLTWPCANCIIAPMSLK